MEIGGVLIIILPFALFIYVSIRRSLNRIKKEERRLAQLPAEEQAKEKAKSNQAVISGLGLIALLAGAQFSDFISVSQAFTVGVILVIVFFLIKKVVKKREPQ
jgi:di/tricarboxylate transporter